MKYITGMQALNLPCSLNTSGDWHQSSMSWSELDMRESVGSFFGNYGIELNSCIPNSTGVFYVANHIRALLDLLFEEKYSLAQGMRKDFICTNEYDNEIFEKVSTMKILPYWENINNFMIKEYKMLWLSYKGGC